MIRNLLLICALTMLAACASTPDKISSIPGFSSAVLTVPAVMTVDPLAKEMLPPLPIQISNPTIVKDLQATAANLDQAVAIGALPKDDPAAPCLHDFMQRAGVETVPGAPVSQSFKPENAGVFSAGSIIYIIAQQQKAIGSARDVKLSPTCLALIGQIHLDAIVNTVKGASRLLPSSILGIR